MVADIVAFSPIPENAQESLCVITGCRNGISPAGEYEYLLHRCGFAETELEPKTVYTTEMLREKAQRKGYMGQLEQLDSLPIDSICGSVIIPARKR